MHAQPALPPVPPEPALPTQSAHPGRATARTLVQSVLGWLIGGGLVLGAVALILQEELGAYLPPKALAIVAAVGTAAFTVATIAARVMAIPQVDQWLARHKATSAIATRPPVEG